MHAMRAVSIIAVLLLLVANALELLPVASPFEPYLSGGALVLGLVALVTILAGRGPERDTRAAAEAARPMPVPTGANYQADAEIVSFLAMLQARGRLVDFLMDDINTYDDAQVGAAARVVHAGCKAALLEHFQISPVRAESEGATVQIAAGYLPDEYRLVGKISGPGAVLRSARPSRLEDGCGEPAARSAELDQPASDNRSGGGGTEISSASNLASTG
jgi:Domain of unknown function (DUF2760).